MGKELEVKSLQKNRLYQIINNNEYLNIGNFAISFKSYYGNTKVYLYYNRNGLIKSDNDEETKRVYRENIENKNHIKVLKKEIKDFEKLVKKLQKEVKEEEEKYEVKKTGEVLI